MTDFDPNNFIEEETSQDEDEPSWIQTHLLEGWQWRLLFLLLVFGFIIFRIWSILHAMLHRVK